jgi:uncharacterized membrane protein YkvA (DUF1232 family)
MNSSAVSLEFLRRVSRPRRSARGRIASIADYIEWRAATLTPEQLEEIRNELLELDRRVSAMRVPEFPHLPRQLKLLMNLFADSAKRVFLGGSEACHRETGFAIRYWAKELDIIPDFASEIGYADDSLVARTVLQRHEGVFLDYCRFRNINWSKIGLAP